jgi:hypothetical protein
LPQLKLQKNPSGQPELRRKSSLRKDKSPSPVKHLGMRSTLKLNLEAKQGVKFEEDSTGGVTSLKQLIPPAEHVKPSFTSKEDQELSKLYRVVSSQEPSLTLESSVIEARPGIHEVSRQKQEELFPRTLDKFQTMTKHDWGKTQARLLTMTKRCKSRHASNSTSLMGGSSLIHQGKQMFFDRVAIRHRIQERRIDWDKSLR